MRIIKALGVSLVVILVVLLVTIYAAREIVLAGSAWLVSSRFATAVKAVESNDYAHECMRLGVFGGEASAQLRFTSDTEYVTEVICGTMTESAIKVDEFKLWPLVHKSTGASGFTQAREEMTVSLEALGRVVAITRDEVGQESTNWAAKAQPISSQGPMTNCAGYGATCCTTGEEQGMGDQVSGAIDCPRSCFASCQNRPVVLAFNSNPFYDFQTRAVTVRKAEEIEFSYVITESQVDFFADEKLQENADPVAFLLSLVRQVLDSKSAQVERDVLREVSLTYGDGKSELLSKLSGTTSHDYNCETDLCTYVASVSAKNSQGASSEPNYLSTITVNVIP